MKAIFYLGLSIISGALSTLFTYAFYWRYWRYRDCIEQAVSSCYVTESGEYTGNASVGGMIWAIPAVLFALLFVMNLFRLRRMFTQNHR